MNRIKKVTGIIFIIISVFTLIIRSDIILELIGGREFNQLDIYKLILPVILMIFASYLLFNQNPKNGIKKTK